MPSLSAEDIAAVRRACDAARANSADAPACLLELVMDWGGSVPPAEPPFPDAEEDPSGPADPEVVAPEADAPVAMGPEVAPELSEKEMDEVMETKQKAADAFADGRFEDAIDAYTVVIQSMPSALVYAKRAEAFVRLRKCVAAIRDCDAALAINPDSAKALKTRGAANRFLGNWERAHADLAKGQAIDFDETSAEIQKVVAERYKAIHAARLKKEAARRDAEKAERERRAEAARKAREEAAAAANAGSFPGGFPGGGFPGGMPGMGGGHAEHPSRALVEVDVGPGTDGGDAEPAGHGRAAGVHGEPGGVCQVPVGPRDPEPHHEAVRSDGRRRGRHGRVRRRRRPERPVQRGFRRRHGRSERERRGRRLRTAHEMSKCRHDAFDASAPRPERASRTLMQEQILPT
jgi:suppressor of tumorigenicity protein 13